MFVFKQLRQPWRPLYGAKSQVGAIDDIFYPRRA